MTTQERADFWRQQITAWLDSGLSGHAFCKSQALVYHQFAYWRKKLEQPAASDSLPGFVRVAMPAPVGTEVGLTRHSAPDLGINLPIALTQYLQNDLLVSC